MKEVAIVNYGAGNLGSLINAIEFLNYKVIILDKPKTNRLFSHIILPGVGAFGTLAKNLVKLKFKDYLIEHKERQKKILGICIGMQLLFEKSEEGKEQKGLEIIKGKIEKFSFKTNSKLPLPNVGFLKVFYNNNSKIWNQIPNNSYFYFVHSYRLKNIQDNINFGKSNYGEEFISYIEKNNIFGTQFHPEKSHKVGLKFLDNFLKY
jgi:glutamine amidotransferase